MIGRPAPPKILVTGFGPFPGTPFNASSTLVRSIPDTPSLRSLGVMFAARLLPTAWREAPKLAEAWTKELQPDAVVHFGVSSRATGFRIETRGVNERRSTRDCVGRFPEGFYVKRGGPPVLYATLPAAPLARELRQAGVPVSLSHDAGRYLCNSVLYSSLLRADSLPHRPLIGFIHIPALSPPDFEPDSGRLIGDWEHIRLGLTVILRKLARYVTAEKRLSMRPGSNRVKTGSA